METKKGEQSFLWATHRPDQKHIPIKLHEDILNCYWIMERTWMFRKVNQRGITWKLKKGILVWDTSMWPNTYSLKAAWRYPKWIPSYVAYKNSEKKNQRGLTWKLRKREQLFLCAIQHPDLIHIPLKLHEDILNRYWIMERTRMFGKINQRGITWKIREGEQSFLCPTHRRDPIHIPKKLHEDIANGYRLMSHTRILEKNKGA